MGMPLWGSAAVGALIGSANVASADNTITLSSTPDDPIVEGQLVAFASPLGGATALRAGVPYYAVDVAGDTFRAAPSPGAPEMEFSADGSVDVHSIEGMYGSETLLSAFGGMHTRGSDGSPVAGRPGLYPAGPYDTRVTVAGTTWNTTDLTGVIRHSSGLTVPFTHAAESGATAAPDSTFGRIDALDIVAHLDEYDGSGQVRTEIVYVTGTPASLPSAPAWSTNGQRLATILVPANGSPSPSVQTHPSMTVMVGGILPVADSTAFPSPGDIHDGQAVWDINDLSLSVNTNGTDWSKVASATNHSYVDYMTSPGQSANNWNSYTPEFINGGSVTYTSRTGRWKRIAPNTIAVNIHIVIGNGGTGSSKVGLRAPTTVRSTGRSMIFGDMQSGTEGEGGWKHIAAIRTSGANDAFNDLRMFQTSTGGNVNMVGTNLLAGAVLTFAGVYAEG